MSDIAEQFKDVFQMYFDEATEHINGEKAEPQKPQGEKKPRRSASMGVRGEQPNTTVKNFFEILKVDNEKRLVTGPVLIPENILDKFW